MMNFLTLINQIQELHLALYNRAVKSVNIHITIRNWIIGFYIVEFEQNGSDRATYGSQLLNRLAKEIKIKGLTSPELSRCRQFYQIYPEILGPLTQKFENFLPLTILGSLTQKFELKGKVDPLTLPDSYYLEFINKVSFTHIVELIKIKEPSKRRFYEMLIMKNTLSVRELEKQIAILTFERVGLSAIKKEL